MATTIPAIMAALKTGTAINNCTAWDVVPPNYMAQPLTAAGRATVITALLGGTITTEASALALIATAATGGVTQKQVWDIMQCNPATVG
jgi:hypothetical protein